MAPTRISLTACLLAAAMLAGCGKSEQKKGDGPPAEYGVFISTEDCLESGKLSEEGCTKVINMAVATHNKDSTVYKFLQKCEAAEGGAERCDKTGEEEYRGRLQAFYVTFGNPPSAVPLYPPQKPSVGFRTLTKQPVDANDPALHISNDAMTLAHENAKLSDDKN